MDFLFKQIRTDTSGTVNIDQSSADIWLIHDAGQVVQTLTIPFPEQDIIDRQLFIINSIGGINSLTLSSNKAIINPATMLFAGGGCAFLYDQENERWLRQW